MFPVSVKQKKRLKFNNSKFLRLGLEIIKIKLQEKKADRVSFGNNRVNFNNNSFFSNANGWDMMRMVDKGYFSYDEKTYKMTYCYSMMTGFIFTSIISIIIYYASENILVGFFAFLWLYGMNLLITITRQSSFFQEVMDEIKLKIIDENQIV